MKKITLALAMTLSTSLLTGCCSLVDGKTQTVSIDTNAPAKYIVKNEDGETVANGVAPAVISLKRGDAPYSVEMQRTEESPKAQGVIKDNMNGYLWGNLLFGGIIGTTIDFVSGAAYDLDPSVRIETIEDGKHYTPSAAVNSQPITINNTIKNTQNGE